ncbi:phage holin family protein [Pedobacter africanus]|jgi:putative membrane protein|uniref:Membrane protein n=2 Tax=Pedobacter africanus TaxID=151894 RepID=A0ACC6L3J7_9SPHI|nr:phage holin family protein [Pedobacter africanus]MDR6785990.1 putative membrane protein [Pedobacter africanus]SMC71051.1 putative membrane protein [Pedobacter africanus]
MRLIVEILLMGLAVLIGAYIVPGVQVDGYGTAIIAAVLIALANATIGFILRVMTFPVNFLTLGLVSFIITVLMILLVDNLMSGFNTTGFWAAAFLAIVVALIKAVFNAVAGTDKD